MNITYSEHAKKRMKQRAKTELHVEQIIKYPVAIIYLKDGKIQAIGEIESREIKIIFAKKETHINIISVR